MKKLAWVLEQRQDEARDRGTRAFRPNCVTCNKSISTTKVATCKLCFNGICSSCKITKKLSFITPDLTLLQRKVPFCVKCLVEATKLDTQEVAREQLEKKNVPYALYGTSVASDLSTCSESTITG
ncbi:uncharacterized protein PHALS_08907 [Plasmopara halstedii]|uniref:Zinc finger, RING/FYVE/PHD-type n=1 Tax=Plasmopara halstedii TaxID=4781 RepID=A0A0P1AD26_PLAHL|nr:uncharacterized protein PHALS_08907 [Plasmopara halstedii]CEG38858.1 hypothetical protein PHALS_08907 [Plasmopara halstedii]|eukprot:XP_024575227.1 hypothetical protein PHALS_08907 [Plasmopara halstedii]